MIVILDRQGRIVHPKLRDGRSKLPRRATYLRACPDCDLLIEHLAQGKVPRAHPNCPARLSAAS